MRKGLGIVAAAIPLIAGSMLIASSASAAPVTPACVTTGTEVTCTFAYTGVSESWTVPSGVTEIHADVLGAEGGSVGVQFTLGGNGGRASATLPVTPGESLLISVGGAGGDILGCGSDPGVGGFNGGAPGGTTGCAAAGGGGASDIRMGGSSLADRVLVAGGGGGSANAVFGDGAANGGAGGGIVGQDGVPIGAGGAGGDQAGGGSGMLGLGSSSQYGGGGGGGYYGGAAGNQYFTIDVGGGGGGGSGFGPSGTVFETGVRSGHGLVTISYEIPSTTIMLTATPALAELGETVDLSARIDGSAPGVDLSGTVEFFADGASLGSASVTAGTARLSVSELQLGTHLVTAVYSGNANTIGSSTAAPAVVTVNPAQVKPAAPISPAPPKRVDTAV